MPKLDLFTYRDFDSLDVELDVGDNAAEKLGSEFKGLYVAAVGPPIHEGKDVVVVLASEHRPDRMQELKTFFQPTATGLGRHQPAHGGSCRCSWRRNGRRPEWADRDLDASSDPTGGEPNAIQPAPILGFGGLSG